MTTSARRVVVVGGAAAGWFAAEGLRRHGFDGEIRIVGAEPPCDRPPLSKQLLSGAWDRDRLTLMPPARMASIGAEFVHDEAVGLDTREKTVRTRAGATLGYDAAVIATGVRPRTLPFATGEGVHALRSVADSVGLREAVLGSRRLVIAGAGFIGLEVAATLCKLGVDVTVVEPAERPLESRIGTAAATRVLDLHRAHGIELRLGVSINSVRRREGAGATSLAAVELSDGTALETDNLLVSIGCVPNVEWLAGSGLDLSNGVVCDAFCAAGPDVWACGDVASWHHAGRGRTMRIEHRTNASEQGLAVARNILGAGLRYTPVPFFWSDQFDVKLQVAGDLAAADEISVELGDLDAGSALVGYRADGALVGLLGWNAPREFGQRRGDLTAAYAVRN